MGSMITTSLEGVIVTQLKEIITPGGNILHAMKAVDPGYEGFGEAYFSKIDAASIKPWKRHRDMTLNLVVPFGSIRFVLFDDRPESLTKDFFQELIISTDNYCRLTVPPKLWMAFQGMGDSGGVLLNIANICHTPDESERKMLDEIPFDWKSQIF